MAERPRICNDGGPHLPECSDCSELENRVENLEECCDEVEVIIEDHEQRITANEGAIESLEPTVVDLGIAVANHEQRIAANEEDILENTADIVQNANNITSLDGRMSTAEYDIDRNTELIYQLLNRGGSPFSIRRSLYITGQASETTIPINIADFSASDDTLIVYISGLALNETEYSISGTNIILDTPITTIGTEVQFVAYRASIVIDPTLTVSGAAADAETTGNFRSDFEALGFSVVDGKLNVTYTE